MRAEFKFIGSCGRWWMELLRTARWRWWDDGDSDGFVGKKYLNERSKYLMRTCKIDVGLFLVWD
jgi:hypothetical protein